MEAWQDVALEAGYCAFPKCAAALEHEAARVRCPNCGGMVEFGETKEGEQ